MVALQIATRADTPAWSYNFPNCPLKIETVGERIYTIRNISKDAIYGFQMGCVVMDLGGAPNNVHTMPYKLEWLGPRQSLETIAVDGGLLEKSTCDRLHAKLTIVQADSVAGHWERLAHDERRSEQELLAGRPYWTGNSERGTKEKRIGDGTGGAVLHLCELRHLQRPGLHQALCIKIRLGGSLSLEDGPAAFKSVRKWDNLSLRIVGSRVQVIASREDYEDHRDAGRNSGISSNGWRARR